MLRTAYIFLVCVLCVSLSVHHVAVQQALRKDSRRGQTLLPQNHLQVAHIRFCLFWSQGKDVFTTANKFKFRTCCILLLSSVKITTSNVLVHIVNLVKVSSTLYADPFQNHVYHWIIIIDALMSLNILYTLAFSYFPQLFCFLSSA